MARGVVVVGCVAGRDGVRTATGAGPVIGAGQCYPERSTIGLVACYRHYKRQVSSRVGPVSVISRINMMVHVL